MSMCPKKYENFFKNFGINATLDNKAILEHINDEIYDRGSDYNRKGKFFLGPFFIIP